MATRHNCVLGFTFSKLFVLDQVSLAERLHIAETLAKLETSIHFGWGSASIRRSSYPSIEAFALMLKRHPIIQASIEGHCGIEVTSKLAHAPMIIGLTPRYRRRLPCMPTT